MDTPRDGKFLVGNCSFCNCSPKRGYLSLSVS